MKILFGLSLALADYASPQTSIINHFREISTISQSILLDGTLPIGSYLTIVNEMASMLKSLQRISEPLPGIESEAIQLLSACKLDDLPKFCEKVITLCHPSTSVRLSLLMKAMPISSFRKTAAIIANKVQAGNTSIIKNLQIVSQSVTILEGYVAYRNSAYEIASKALLATLGNDFQEACSSECQLQRSKWEPLILKASFEKLLMIFRPYSSSPGDWIGDFLRVGAECQLYANMARNAITKETDAMKRFEFAIQHDPTPCAGTVDVLEHSYRQEMNDMFKAYFKKLLLDLKADFNSVQLVKNHFTKVADLSKAFSQEATLPLHENLTILNLLPHVSVNFDSFLDMYFALELADALRPAKLHTLPRVCTLIVESVKLSNIKSFTRLVDAVPLQSLEKVKRMVDHGVFQNAMEYSSTPGFTLAQGLALLSSAREAIGGYLCYKERRLSQAKAHLKLAFDGQPTEISQIIEPACDARNLAYFELWRRSIHQIVMHKLEEIYSRLPENIVARTPLQLFSLNLESLKSSLDYARMESNLLERAKLQRGAFEALAQDISTMRSMNLPNNAERMICDHLVIILEDYAQIKKLDLEMQ